MQKARLSEMTNGWFVGDFEPSILRSPHAEVAVKTYQAGDAEGKHVHRVAHEVTLLLHGRAEMADQVLEAGDILVLAPGEPTGFRALTDCTTVVVKLPSVMGDKYDVPD